MRNTPSTEFERELEELINKHSVENIVNIPDYMLAGHICAHIAELGSLLAARDKWFSFKPFGENDVRSIEN